MAAFEALHVNSITKYGTKKLTDLFLSVFLLGTVCCLVHIKVTLACVQVLHIQNPLYLFPIQTILSLSRLSFHTFSLADKSTLLFVTESSRSPSLLQIMALSGKCFPLSINPWGAAYWRRLNCFHPGRGSPSEAC